MLVAPEHGGLGFGAAEVETVAEETGAALLLIWAERLPQGRGYAVRVGPATPLPAGAADDEALQVACATSVNRDMERLIAGCPGQYLWGYDRYKQPRRAHRVTGEEGAG